MIQIKTSEIAQYPRVPCKLGAPMVQRWHTQPSLSFLRRMLAVPGPDENQGVARAFPKQKTRPNGTRHHYLVLARSACAGLFGLGIRVYHQRCSIGISGFFVHHNLFDTIQSR